MNKLQDIEDTVINYLKQKLKGVSVKKYAGEFDGDSSSRISFQAPAFFVSFLGAKFDTKANTQLVSNTKWAGFLILHQSQRQTKIEKQLLEAVIAALHNSSLGLKSLPIKLQSFEQILTNQLQKTNLSAWVMRWNQDLTLFADAWDDNTNVPKILVSTKPETGLDYKEKYKEVTND